MRKRRGFGIPILFTDRNATDAKSGSIDCYGYDDFSYDLNKTELDKGIQVSPFLTFFQYTRCFMKIKRFWWDLVIKTVLTHCQNILKAVKNVTDRPLVHTKTAHFCRQILKTVDLKTEL